MTFQHIAFFILGEFPCVIIKAELGYLCGYLGVPPSHPWYGHDDDIDAQVHGGLTYASHETFGHPRAIEELTQKIADLTRLERERDPPQPIGDLSLQPIIDMHQRTLDVERERAGESRAYPYETGQDVWWLGFDCAHAGDLIPSIADIGGTYKDEAYVRAELEDLARQAAEDMQEVIA
jgi:hypothetical protein